MTKLEPKTAMETFP